MNIKDLTLGEIETIRAMFPGSNAAVAETPFPIGKPFMVRTVTHIVTGRLQAVTDKEFVMTDAAWIADTDRYANAVKSGVFKEVEPYPDGVTVFVGRGSLIDAAEIPKLPRDQK